jgi:hypothetical protein
MRELTLNEMTLVAGGTGVCTPANSGGGNSYGGVTQPGSLGRDLIDIYEGLVAATSYVIERVAKAF